MPRPTSKQELLEAIERERARLDAVLEAVPPERMVEPGAVGAWSVKDVLAHLVEWERMALGWYRGGLRGEVPEVPAPGHKWNQTPQLNRAIFEKHRDRPLDEVVADFRASRREMLGVIESLTDEDLFTRGRFAWTRKNTWARTSSPPPAATTCGRGRASRAGCGGRHRRRRGRAGDPRPRRAVRTIGPLRRGRGAA